MSNRKTPQTKSLNRGFSLKFVAFLVVGLAIYGLVQPLVNRSFGLKLPGVWQIVEQLQSPDSSKTRKAVNGTAKAEEKALSPGSQNEEADSEIPSQKTLANRTPGADVDLPGSTGTLRKAQNSDVDVESYLKKLSKNRYQSPAGLVYAPGSDEGHRLKHIERHLTDITNRPGSHGVFQGSMIDFLKAIDQAYVRASKREKGTSMKEDDGATVYEASFNSPIGYLGGEAGKRQKNPKLNRMRLVIRDNNLVITAFPIR